ncbi:hypothetical protein EFA69_00065 [Rufibacter immobilis]|uniref:MotA/TolQ/ExbB proton channel family protein n=1 Tax=Rufibacter immobilis TaxID=1348778 RepID=A0A3M9N542_9BACT|nr:hypothetical protein [Rufibacter immobilis]RNI32856.1 hypothetical protein EFA69_00065 [Rufibacter immobilis]
MLSLFVLAQVPATEPGQAGMSLLDLLLKGGMVMIPISLLSLAALYIFIERMLYLKSAGKTDPAFLKTIEQKILQGQLREASSLCEVTPTPAPAGQGPEPRGFLYP